MSLGRAKRTKYDPSKDNGTLTGKGILEIWCSEFKVPGPNAKTEHKIFYWKLILKGSLKPWALLYTSRVNTVCFQCEILFRNIHHNMQFSEILEASEILEVSLLRD